MKASTGSLYLRFENGVDGRYPVFLTEWEKFLKTYPLLDEAVKTKDFIEEGLVEFPLGEKRSLGAEAQMDGTVHFFLQDDGQLKRQFILTSDDWGSLLATGVEGIQNMVESHRPRRNKRKLPSDGAPPTGKKTLYNYEINGKEGPLYTDGVYYAKKQQCAGAAIIKVKSFGPGASFSILTYRIKKRSAALLAGDLLFVWEDIHGCEMKADLLKTLLEQLHNNILRWTPGLSHAGVIVDCLFQWRGKRTAPQNLEDDYATFLENRAREQGPQAPCKKAKK